MNTDVLMQRAQLLLNQKRPDQAAEQLRQLLSQDPDQADAHAMLSLCMLHDKDQWHDATREAEQAIHLAPDSSLSHYALATVLQKRKRLPEALTAAQESIRLSPYSAHNYSLAASIEAQQERWSAALETASQGMSIDPDNEGCAAVRSLALERLGRTSDAAREADAAVARNPDSAEAHSMRGWTQLQKGDYKAAQESFREALRLDPTYAFAQSGMIQALNSNHLLFRMIFRFYSFLGRMAQGARWAIIIGLFLGMRLLRGLADQYPQFAPYVIPISILYLGFCLLSWIATPLFNTFLRFHPFGKYLLSDKQKWASNLVAACLACGVLGGLFQAVQGDIPGALIMFIAPILLALPISTAFEVDQGWPMMVAVAASVVLGLLCLATVAMLAINGPWVAPYGLYILGILVFSFAGNYLQSVTVRH